MWAGTWKQEYVLKERRTSRLRNNLGKQKRKGAVLLLNKLRPYASNAAAVRESFTVVLLSCLIEHLFSVCCGFRGTWKLLVASLE